jgi:hypothetical protein
VSSAAPVTRNHAGLRSLGRAGVHLTALASLAFAQPLLDVLGRYPAFFAAHDVTRWGVVAFALALLLGPGLILLGIEALATLASRRAGQIVHLVFVGGLGAVFALTLMRRLGWAPAPTFAVSAGLGAALAAGYARAEVLRSICSVLGLAPILFGFLFLFTSNASSLVTAGDARVWDARGTSSPPIVLVSFDAFPVQMLMDRDSHIDAGRFPNFAAFARSGTWYPNATNVHENTVFSVPSILDGKLPEPGQEPAVHDHPDNLFTLLGHTYEMRVSEEATNLCPAGLCERPNDPGGTARLAQLVDDASVVYEYLVAPNALRDRLPAINDRWRNFRESARRGQAPRNTVINRLVGGERPKRFRGSVAAIRAGTRPTLDFMHVLLPHEPLEYLPTGQRYQAGSTRDPSLDGPPSYDNAFLSDQAFQRHLLQVGFVDRLLGELMAQLRRAGLWDRALVVLTADHGISFRVKPTPAPPFVLGRLGYRRELTPDNAEDIVTVPLFVKYPEQREGRIDPKWGRTIDVLPTIADVLGIRLPFRVDGRSLRPPRPVPAALEFRRSDSSRVDIDRATLEQRKAQSLAHQIGLLGTTSWDRAYRIGPHPELIGKDVATLSTLPRGELSATVEDAGKLAQVDPDSSDSPSHVAGRLSGADPADRELAFAVNGRIVSTGRSFASLGPHRLSFSSMLPPDAFRRGGNQLDVYELDSSSGRLGLVPLGRVGAG